jgi:hypothetical protein
VAAQGRLWRLRNKKKLRLLRSRRKPKDRAYYVANRVRILARDRRYRLERKEQKATTDRAYRIANREKINRSKRLWRLKNRAHVNAWHRAWSAKRGNKAYAKQKAWVEKNRTKINAKNARKKNWLYKTNSNYNVNVRMAVGIRSALAGTKGWRSWQSLVGYTLSDLVKHLESKFTGGMSWELFRAGKIHIDHKIPKSKFQFSSASDPGFRSCWALSNLQPMWAIENLSKHDKYDFA